MVPISLPQQPSGGPSNLGANGTHTDGLNKAIEGQVPGPNRPFSKDFDATSGSTQSDLTTQETTDSDHTPTEDVDDNIEHPSEIEDLLTSLEQLNSKQSAVSSAEGGQNSPLLTGIEATVGTEVGQSRTTERTSQANTPEIGPPLADPIASEENESGARDTSQPSLTAAEMQPPSGDAASKSNATAPSHANELAFLTAAESTKLSSLRPHSTDTISDLATRGTKGPDQIQPLGPKGTVVPFVSDAVKPKVATAAQMPTTLSQDAQLTGPKEGKLPLPPSLTESTTTARSQTPGVSTQVLAPNFPSGGSAPSFFGDTQKSTQFEAQTLENRSSGEAPPQISPSNSAQASQTTGYKLVTTQLMPGPDLVNSVSQQLAASVQKLGTGQFEVSLSPAELGRVRISLETVDGALHVTLHAERDETMDLIKRNLDSLERQFKDVGHTDLSFSFADGAQSQDDQEGSNQGSVDGPAELAQAETQQKVIAVMNTDRIDVRI